MIKTLEQQGKSIDKMTKEEKIAEFERLLEEAEIIELRAFSSMKDYGKGKVMKINVNGTIIKYSIEKVEMKGGKVIYPFIPMMGRCKILISKDLSEIEHIATFAHEKKHVEQYSKVFFHALKYRFFKKYRYKCELEAYRETMKVHKYKSLKDLDWIIQSLYKDYDLGSVWDLTDISSDVYEIYNDLKRIYKS